MKISVALCTYNGEKFIRKQINSILDQNLEVNEIIVCDDCSTDATWTILEEYKKNSPNIFQIYKNEVNIKSNKNFEKAIALCTGDYIFLSDQDDIWRMDKVEKTLISFKQNPTAEAVFSNASLIDDADNPILASTSIWDSFLFYESKMTKPVDLFEFLIANGNFVTGATLCIKKEVKDYCFPFITSNLFLHDEWLALLLSKRKKLSYTTDKLLFYRLHDEQQLGVGNKEKITNTNKKSIKEQEIIMKLRQAKSFDDFKFLTNRYYEQYDRLKKLKSQNISTPMVNELLDIVTDSFIKINLEMKRRYPIRYFLRKRKNDNKNRMQIDVKY